MSLHFTQATVVKFPHIQNKIYKKDLLVFLPQTMHFYQNDEDVFMLSYPLFYPCSAFSLASLEKRLSTKVSFRLIVTQNGAEIFFLHIFWDESVNRVMQCCQQIKKNKLPSQVL
jgi:hypothetical protein